MKLIPIFEVMAKDENERKFQIQNELDNIIMKYDVLGLTSWIHLQGDYAIQIASIKVTDKSKRRQGLGSALMTEITNLCDKYGLLCTLTPEPTETPKSVLLRFYKGFGFIPNSGRYKDFRFKNSMIRHPKTNV